MRTVNGLEEMQRLVGEELGVSDWHPVTQEEIDLFARATHDHQWIHVDPERCRRESPFGGPIAHGYYTLSLTPYLLGQVLRVEGVRMGVNYGLNKMRLPSPLPVGAKVRARATLNGYEAIQGGASATIGVTFEVENQAKPACVAEVIYRYYL
jgi:acyl dehydratase